MKHEKLGNFLYAEGSELVAGDNQCAAPVAGCSADAAVCREADRTGAAAAAALRADPRRVIP